MQQYGTSLETFARIRAKASRHAANNPMALFRQVVSPEEVMASPMIWPGVMTRLMACPPTCGAAAAILCSPAFAERHGLDRSVRIRAGVTVRGSISIEYSSSAVTGYRSAIAATARTQAACGR